MQMPTHNPNGPVHWRLWIEGHKLSTPAPVFPPCFFCREFFRHTIFRMNPCDQSPRFFLPCAGRPSGRVAYPLSADHRVSTDAAPRTTLAHTPKAVAGACVAQYAPFREGGGGGRRGEGKRAGLCVFAFMYLKHVRPQCRRSRIAIDVLYDIYSQRTRRSNEHPWG